MTIKTAINEANAELMQTSSSARLDAEVLLAHVLEVPRSYLLAWPERVLNASEQVRFAAFITRRVQGEPLAYLTGQREFWGLNLAVTKDTLVPRPDTELLVEIILKTLPATSQHIVDLGTGAGPIALALASARPAWQIYATDRIAATLKVAELNAERSQITNVSFHNGFWYEALPNKKFTAIISNPPYVADNDVELAPEVKRYEPHAALFAGADGLTDLRYIIANAAHYLEPRGLLLVEHGTRQAQAVSGLFQAAGFQEIITYRDISGWERATLGYKIS